MNIPSVEEIKNHLDSLLGPNEKGLLNNHLNSTAVIAGGAVANFIYNKVHNGSAPINDIDVFIFQLKPVTDNEPNLDGAVVDYINEIGTDNNYKISKTERKGLINYIYVDVDYMTDLKSLATNLLNDFDINATKAAILLNNRYFSTKDKDFYFNDEILIQEEFTDFLKTKELKSLKTKTPLKTMMRLLKKQKEFGAYLNEEHLDSVYQVSRGKRIHITGENFKKFSNEINTLRPYFRFFKMANGQYKSWSMKEFDKLHTSEKRIMKNSKLKKYLIPIFDWKKSGKKSYEKYLKLRPYYNVLKAFITKNIEEKVKQDFNPKDLMYVSKVIRKVQVSSAYFRNLSLRDAIIQAKFLVKFEKTDNEIYLAFLGRLSSYNFAMKNEEIQEHFKAFKKTYIDSQKPINIPYTLSKELEKNCVELNSQIALAEEGKKMGHCVGGYAEKVRENKSRIFSISTDEELSTLEVRVEEAGIRGIQHRARFNKFPSKKNREIAIALINYINKNLFKNSNESDFDGSTATYDLLF